MYHADQLFRFRDDSQGPNHTVQQHSASIIPFFKGHPTADSIPPKGVNSQPPAVDDQLLAKFVR